MSGLCPGCCGRRRSTTAGTRRPLPSTTGRTGTPPTSWRATTVVVRRRRSATPVSTWQCYPGDGRLRRDRAGCRLAGRALRRGTGRRGPAGGRGGAGTGGRRVLLLRVHPVQDAAAAGGGGARGAGGGGDRTGRRRGGTGLARLHGLELLRRRPGTLAGRQGHRPA